MEYSDRLVGHPTNIDCLCPLNESILLTGSSDGFIRAVNILPNAIHGIVGNHGPYPIERLLITSNKTSVFSCGHDGLVKMWDIDMLSVSKDSHLDEAIFGAHPNATESSSGIMCEYEDIHPRPSPNHSNILSINESSDLPDKQTFIQKKMISKSRKSTKSKKAKLDKFFSDLL